MKENSDFLFAIHSREPKYPQHIISGRRQALSAVLYLAAGQVDSERRMILEERASEPKQRETVRSIPTKII